jgi:hypothetical protein
LQRLQKNGFKAILPGIESWYSMGGKSKTGGNKGLEKVRQVSDHVNTILRYIPYVQANFVLGLDDDTGEEPFELTKKFVDLTPGAFPAYSLLSAFGQAAPLNLDLQRDGRRAATPFHFLDNNKATNVRPKNYTWNALYDNIIGPAAPLLLLARHRAPPAREPGAHRALSELRARGVERRLRPDPPRRHRPPPLDQDASVRPFFEGRARACPSFYTDSVRKDLGHWWERAPRGLDAPRPQRVPQGASGRPGACATTAVS